MTTLGEGPTDAQIEEKFVHLVDRYERFKVNDAGVIAELRDLFSSHLTALTERVRAVEGANKDLQVRNERMRGYLQRHGYGHTDWPEDVIGCQKPRPGCMGTCLARCENVDNLNVLVYDLRAQLTTAERELEEARAALREAPSGAHYENCAINRMTWSNLGQKDEHDPGPCDCWIAETLALTPATVAERARRERAVVALAIELDAVARERDELISALTDRLEECVSLIAAKDAALRRAHDCATLSPRTVESDGTVTGGTCLGCPVSAALSLAPTTVAELAGRVTAVVEAARIVAVDDWSFRSVPESVSSLIEAVRVLTSPRESEGPS